MSAEERLAASRKGGARSKRRLSSKDASAAGIKGVKARMHVRARLEDRIFKLRTALRFYRYSVEAIDALDIDDRLAGEG